MVFEEKLKKLLEDALKTLGFPIVPIQMTPPSQKGHGDLSTNLGFQLAKAMKKSPLEVANLIVQNISLPSSVSAEVAGSGFINFKIGAEGYFKELKIIESQKEKYGSSDLCQGEKVLLEFVSANPTGPLNVVSARAAAVGDTLANLLGKVGFKVLREYYVNDVGNQIDLLALSLEARYLQALGRDAKIPVEGYQGEYLKDLASNFAKKNKKLSREKLKGMGLKALITSQKRSLKNFGVSFDRWYFQSELFQKKKIEASFKKLEEGGWLYQQEGATFFRSTTFGDDKDRVIQKQDGEYAYFASDIAYHRDKFERGFSSVIDLLGPDHHGYVARTKAAVQALGFDPNKLTILIIQQVHFLENEVLVKMSKRKGKLITMDDLVEEVGVDVARYFFLQRSHKTPLEFDLELAKKQSLDNPVYYIQYAHARIASIFRKAKELQVSLNFKNVDYSHLDLPEEKELAKTLLSFPNCLKRAALDLEPHLLAFYALELSKLFQSYYSQAKHDPRYRVLDQQNRPKTVAKLYLLKNLQIVIKNALKLMGISAPDRMEKDPP